MRIAEIIGTVTLSRVHPSLVGGRWLIGVPYSLEGLQRNESDGEDLIIFDHLGAGIGNKIGFSESGEAAAPFYPEKKPIDAYCSAILDQIQLSERGTAR